MRIFLRCRNFYIFEIRIKGVAGIIQFFNEFDFIVFGINVEGSAEYDEFYLVGFMTGKLQRKQSIVYLFDRIEFIEQCSHSAWFGFDIALGHCRIIGTENTFSWTCEGFGKHLYRNNSRL